MSAAQSMGHFTQPTPAIPLPPALSSLPSSVNLICIDPSDIRYWWQHLAPLIHRAMWIADIGQFSPVEQDVLDGRALLWLAVQDINVLAAAVTEITNTESRKKCTIVACGGKDMRQWLHLIEGIENYARGESCSATRIIGRKGWMRMLKDYRATRVILEKAL